MTSDEFWELIDLIIGEPSDQDRSDLTMLTITLSQRSPEEIEAFFEHLALRLHALDTRAHYRAFSWFPGEADPFLYARLSVVARGEVYYGRILENPALFQDGWNEDLLYVADSAYQLRTGKEFPRESSVDFEAFQNREGWKR
jgi:hypothetical protein